MKAKPLIKRNYDFEKEKNKQVRKISRKNKKVKRIFGKTMRKYIK